MKKRLKITTAVLCTILSTGQAAMQILADAEIQKYSNTDFAMDTVVSETLYTTGEDINILIGSKLREMEEDLLSWTDENSQISKVNASAGTVVEISEELAEYLKSIEQLSEDSGGAFDPTLGKVIRLWDIDGGNPHVPDQTELDDLLKDTGYQKIVLDGNQVILEKGTTLDFGAVGKGIGCDVISDFLKTQTDVSGMIMNLGGSSVMAYGKKPDGSKWKVAVTDPREPDGDYLGTVMLEDGEFLSTSGDYEKYFMEDGKRYHHILDPVTGYPVWNGLTAVTVVCNSGLFADGLSTACFVLGKDEAVKLLEKYDADALFTDENRNVWMTSGMKERFHLMKDSYTVKEQK